MEPALGHGIVQVHKLDPQGRRTIVWAGRVLEHTAEHILLCALFNRSGRDLGYVVLERGDVFLEWYYFARWYNVFQIYSRAGELKGWYCNIGRPPEVGDAELRYVDLALDVFVGPDGDHLVLDADEGGHPLPRGRRVGRSRPGRAGRTDRGGAAPLVSLQPRDRRAGAGPAGAGAG
jgi:hypothetical protein